MINADDMKLGDLRQGVLIGGWLADLIWQLDGTKYISMQRNTPTKRLFVLSGTENWDVLINEAVEHSMSIDIADELL